MSVPNVSKWTERRQRLYWVLSCFLVVAVLGTPVFAEDATLQTAHPVEAIRLDNVTGLVRVTALPMAQRLPGVTLHPLRAVPAIWQQFPAGMHNAITDVPGVKVGQISVLQNHPQTIRTGVTTIVPDMPVLTDAKGNLANTALRAAAVVLNGNGEMTGLAPIMSAGLLNSPIVLTNTYSIGAAHQGVFQYFKKHDAGQWKGELPVVGECWDGFFNTLDPFVLTPEDTVTALEAAGAGPVLQGRVGAGTGMRSFGMHAGIGSASRKIKIGEKEFTVGVLVNTNHSKLESLNPLIRAELEKQWGVSLPQVREQDEKDKAVQSPKKLAASRQGSIIVIIATDLPLDASELKLIAERAAIGIGNTGSHMAMTSGDFALAFSTANPVYVGDDAPAFVSSTHLHPDALTPVFHAVIEAVTEAQVNALTASHTGFKTTPALPSR